MSITHRETRRTAADPLLDRRTFRLNANEKIDFCRGFFAILVVMDHALQIAWGINPGAKEQLPWYVQEALRTVVNCGTIAVMGFFVISGYCIQLSVGRLNQDGQFPLKTYLLARASRILPLYYPALLTAIVVERLIAGARPDFWPHGLSAGVIFAQLFVVQNLSQTYGSFAASWSITNEAFYYVFYGLLATLACGRRSRPAWIGMGLCVAVTALTQGLYVTVARTPVVYAVGQLLGLGIIWFLGVLVAVHAKDLLRFQIVRRAAMLWPVVLAAAFGWRFFHMPPHGLYLIPGVAFALMLLHFLDADRRVSAEAFHAENGARTRCTSLIATFGLASYPMYLFHGPLLMLAGSMLLRWGIVPGWRQSWVLLAILGIASGIALGILLERPVMAWRAGMLRRLRRSESLLSAPGPHAILGKARAS